MFRKVILSKLPVSIMSGESRAGTPRRDSSQPWFAVALSVVGSGVAVAAVGCLCALIYPILKELRASRVKGENGIEERMLGFWSILVLSALVGSSCSVFSWTLTYFDSFRPGVEFPTPLTLPNLRGVSGHGSHMNYGMAALNGIMAMLTVIWSLS